MENYDVLLEKAKLLKISDCSKNDAIDELFPELKPVWDKEMMELLENILLAADTVATREIYGIYGRTKEDLIDWVKCLKKSNDQIYSQEGERIRNGLIGWLRICGERNQNLVGLGGISPKECMSWLEFQPSKFIQKFKVGDVVTNGESTYTIDRISSDCYLVKEHDCATIPFESEPLWRLVDPENAGWISDLQQANLVYQMAMNVNMVIEAKNLVKSGLEKAHIWDLVVDTIKQMDHNNDAEKEKSDFVSGKFLYCRGSFLDFKEGETYWLEYIGDDTYVGRSDNALNQKFRITPRLLYTWFTDHIPCWIKDENANLQNKHENQNTESIASDEETDIQKARREGRNDGIEIVINHPDEYGLQRKCEWSEEDERIHTIKVFYPSIGIGVEDAVEKCIAYSKKEGDMLISINGIFLLVTQSSTVEKVMKEYNKCVGNNNDIKEKSKFSGTMDCR